ncbi:helix-turn-helix domain-containing protein [Hymenobacter terrenus]|uniref:helix-turn-helix domain-containing protein n=1 Tax=Hymenobacter terrenus TaxID=1629124 RepID=UPI000619DFE5|nr:helix-turn-helix domain-containing protein [Hymenobacter terrenus]
MQVTITLPPDLISTLVETITSEIRRELAAASATTAKTKAATALLTVDELASRLKLHEKTVVRYIRSGRINASNHGTLARPAYRVAEADYEAFYKANRAR